MHNIPSLNLHLLSPPLSLSLSLGIPFDLFSTIQFQLLFNPELLTLHIQFVLLEALESIRRAVR